MQPPGKSHTGLFVGLLILVCLLLIGVAIFGIWAYQGRQDYKNNTDQKIAAAVTVAKQDQTSADQQKFAEEAKNPLRTYVGPSAYGSIRLQYPRTWSVYVVSGSDPILDAYFAPQVVPDVQNDNSVYSLRLQISASNYNSVLAAYSSAVQSSTVSVEPYKLPSVPSVVGAKLTGQLNDNKNGTLVLIPLRADTLEVWVESNQYLNDFNKYILPNLSFSP